MSQSNLWNRFFYTLNGVSKEAIIKGTEAEAEQLVTTWNRQGYNGKYVYVFTRIARTLPVTNAELELGIEHVCTHSNVTRLLYYK